MTRPALLTTALRVGGEPGTLIYIYTLSAHSLIQSDMASQTAFSPLRQPVMKCRRREWSLMHLSEKCQRPNVTIDGAAGEDGRRVSHIRCQSVNGECEINNTPYEDFTHAHTRTPDSKQIWLSLTSRQGTDCKQFTGSPKNVTLKALFSSPISFTYFHRL